jgi:hypothetical protein
MGITAKAALAAGLLAVQPPAPPPPPPVIMAPVIMPAPAKPEVPIWFKGDLCATARYIEEHYFRGRTVLTDAEVELADLTLRALEGCGP